MNKPENLPNSLLMRIYDVMAASRVSEISLGEGLTGLQSERTPPALELPNLYFAFALDNWPPHKFLFKLLRRGVLFPLMRRQVLFNQSVQNVLEGYRRELDAAHHFAHQASVRITELEEQLALLKQEREETS